MGGCQNYGPFWGTLNIRCRIITGIRKGTIILTTTHMPQRHMSGLAALAQPVDKDVRACYEANVVERLQASNGSNPMHVPRLINLPLER